MYAKLNNGEIEFAQINKITINEDGTIDTVFNYGEDVDLLTQDGFLPYSENEAPILTEGQTLEINYIQNKKGITKKYTIIPASTSEKQL